MFTIEVRMLSEAIMVTRYIRMFFLLEVRMLPYAKMFTQKARMLLEARVFITLRS